VTAPDVIFITGRLEENWTSQEGSDQFATLALYTHRYRTGAGRFDEGESAHPILALARGRRFSERCERGSA
jgi:hypothetical protein